MSTTTKETTQLSQEESPFKKLFPMLDKLDKLLEEGRRRIWRRRIWRWRRRWEIWRGWRIREWWRIWRRWWRILCPFIHRRRKLLNM
ncbi:UNVERIFIED_CONTAM: hypothetical protein GTU68_022471 [Idotea baltica]|nr:hypothetical protein [Idotea baltica]